MSRLALGRAIDLLTICLLSKALLRKTKKQRKKLFLCFIDFKKAYDSVRHAGLLYKLRGIGLSDNYSLLLNQCTNKAY